MSVVKQDQSEKDMIGSVLDGYDYIFIIVDELDSLSGVKIHSNTSNSCKSIKYKLE